MSRRPFILLAALALAPACANDPGQAPSPSSAPAKAGLPDHDTALAHKLISAGGLLLDVREPDEFADKHVDGAVNIPVSQIDTRLADVEKLAGGDKKKPIVVYCASGMRSSAAKKILLKAGYEQVTNLGRMSNWERR